MNGQFGKTLLRAMMLQAALLVLTVAGRAESARAVAPTGDNSVNGGFGFQAGLSESAPGGFKWFNEYNRGLSDFVWLNVQVNLSLGGNDTRDCWYDSQGNYHCNAGHWSGNDLEFAFGPKLRFPVSKFPIILDAKLGGFLDLAFLSGDFWAVSTGFRGGVGVHYFFFDNLAVGTEFMFNLGAAFPPGGAGVFATLDCQVIGVEFRF